MTLPGYEISGKKYDLTYIALGAGVQSSALLLMSNLGLYDVPRADVAIFADTGAEPPDVYRVLEELEKASSIPVVRVGDANLEEEFIQGAVHGEGRFVNLPLYLEGGGLLRRGCTAEKKVKPILLYIKREMLGLKPRQRVKSSVRAMMGISWDEVQRVKPSPDKWCDMAYPLVDNRITRHKCREILAEYGEGTAWPHEVGRSACIWCPFHSDSFWKEMKERDEIPGDSMAGLFSRACEFDDKIRDQSKTGLKRRAFLHKSCKPLRDIDWTRGGQTEFALDFTGCDSGHCGI